MTHILVDTTNMFFRAKHVVRGEDLDTKVGMAMHIMFASVNKVWRDFEGKHVVFCFEGHSWRKQEYEPYKRNRKEKREALTVKEREEEEYFFEKFGEFQSFLAKRTNCSVLRHENCEADDMIARWIQLHPDVDHVIVSSDSDFYQLLNNNVKIYNGITDTTITMEGYYNGKGKPVIDKKTGQPKESPNPEWLLFEKCMRGDTSDNIFSAYPGVRTKGTKNKVGLLEAFDDRDKQGYSWNNLMLQRWTDHNGEEHRVLDDYERNRKLIDLREQPKQIKDVMDETITKVVQQVQVTQVGVHFMKFCGKYNLDRVGQQAQDHASYLTAGYA